MSRKRERDCGQLQELAARLEASESRLRNLIERSPDAMVIVDTDGVVQFVNRGALALFQADEAAFIGQPFGLPVTAGETTDVDIVTRRGEDRVAEMRVVETEWNGNKAHIAVLRDITERARAERALRENEKRLTLAMEVVKLGFWDMDLPSGRMIGDEKLLMRLGYDGTEVRPHRDAWDELIFQDDVPRVRQAFAEHLQGLRPIFHAEYRLRAKSGELRWIVSQGEVVERAWDGSPSRVIGVIEDITEQKQIQERIHRVSRLDPLTGLPNRVLLYEFAEHLLSGARRDDACAAFLLIDLDRFKPINDAHGHDVGDGVLKEVAIRLLDCIRRGDFVARTGGDQFLVLLSQIPSAEDAAKAARHALERLRRPYNVLGMEITVTPSIGISLFPQDGDDLDDLIQNADTAMFHVKESSKNDFQFFKQEFNVRLQEALRIESRLRSAHEQREFAVFYQPVVDTETQAAVGAEALLRWPALALGPDRFVPVAEKAGFMPILGEWVVHEVCRQQRQWRDKGLPALPVAVNVSPLQFHQKHFVDSVRTALEMSGVAPDALRVEVTESAVMKNVEEAAGVLSRLRDMGIKVALDDFGTGYSSLSYLSHLPIDILKLDQSFMKGLGHNGANLAIAEGVIALARSLGLEVIAEGVESEEALAFLRARQCRRGQGFHFSRPLSAVEFETWVGRRAA